MLLTLLCWNRVLLRLGELAQRARPVASHKDDFGGKTMQKEPVENMTSSLSCKLYIDIDPRPTPYSKDTQAESEA